jgi:hypothetical protein
VLNKTSKIVKKLWNEKEKGKKLRTFCYENLKRIPRIVGKLGSDFKQKAVVVLESIGDNEHVKNIYGKTGLFA